MDGLDFPDRAYGGGMVHEFDGEEWIAVRPALLDWDSMWETAADLRHHATYTSLDLVNEMIESISPSPFDLTEDQRALKRLGLTEWPWENKGHSIRV